MKRKVIALTFLLILLILGFLLINGCSESSEPKPESKLKPSGKIEILDWHNRLSDPPFYYYVEGILKNVGNKTVDFVKVTIKALDKNNKLVSISYSYADPFTVHPNQEVTFQVMVENKSEIEKFKIAVNWE